MIVQEALKGGRLIKSYSDKGMYITQVETGIKYVEAIDSVPLKYTYTESEELIPKEQEHERRTPDRGSLSNKRKL